MSKDIFSEENVVNTVWHKWDEPGSQISGVYIDKTEQESSYKEGAKQHIYVLVTEGGPVNVPAPGTREFSFMANVPFGAVIGLKFVEEIPAKKAGMKPIKSIKLFWPKDQKTGQPLMDMETYKKYKGTNVFSEQNVIADEDGLPPM